MTRCILPLVLAADGSATPSKSLLEYIKAGGLPGYVILLLSFGAVALVIRYLLEVRSGKVCPPDIVDELRGLARAGNLAGVREFAGRHAATVGVCAVVSRGLARAASSPLGSLELRGALEEAGQREADRLYRTTDGIGLIAGVAPMLGLLGTTLGMIGAFATIGNLEGAARSQQLAGFMSLALVTTAEGLFVAIPCTAIYSIFRRRIDHFLVEIAETCEQVVVCAERQGEVPAERSAGRVGAAARPAAARSA